MIPSVFTNPTASLLRDDLFKDTVAVFNYLFQLRLLIGATTYSREVAPGDYTLVPSDEDAA